MKNVELHRLMYLEAVNGDRDFHELYTKESRYSDRLGIDYKWVSKIREFLKGNKYIKVAEGKKYLVLTSKGLKYLRDLQSNI